MRIFRADHKSFRAEMKPRKVLRGMDMFALASKSPASNIVRKGDKIFFSQNAFDDKLHNNRHNGELLTRSYNTDVIQTQSTGWPPVSRLDLEHADYPR